MRGIRMIDKEDLEVMFEAFEEGLHWDGAWTARLLTGYRKLSILSLHLASRLRNAEDLLENCGYCRECYWDKESISDIAENILRYFRLGELTQKVWPNDCEPLCESCMVDFKEMIE
tara:strand:- start:133 stop:480 length:348 start_codon:yes stop_codon:yes gene_type:complete